MNTESQKLAILRHLGKGHTITQAEAYEKFRCWRLSGRILEIRAEGHEVETSMVRKNGKRYAEYFIPRAIRAARRCARRGRK